MISKILKTTTIFLNLGLGILSAASVQAQIIPPGIPSEFLEPSDVMNSVRTAMIDFPSPNSGGIYQLAAIVHKSEINGSVELFLQTSVEYASMVSPTNITITNNFLSPGWGGSHTSTPDVIIGHDPQRIDAFIVAVAYTEWNGSDYEVYLSRYEVAIDPFTDFIASVTPFYPAEFVGIGYDPSMDVMADIYQEIEFFDEARPTMPEFVLTYNELPGPQMVVLRNGIMDPVWSGPSATYPAVNVQDICAVFDADQGESFAYLVFYEDSPAMDILVKQISLNSWADSDQFLTASPGYHKFRIEGYSVTESSSGKPIWMATGNLYHAEVHTFTDNGSVFTNTPVWPLDVDQNTDSDVTAGLGNNFPSSGWHWGNNQYTFAWSRPTLPGIPDPGFFGNYVDNGMGLSSGPYEQINDQPVITANDGISCISISNSCNGGENMIVAYNAGNEVFYKYTGPAYNYGPTKTRRLPVTAAVKVYPNPASDLLHIGNIATYETLHIFNAQGQEVYKAAVGQKDASSVDISQLPAGNYKVYFSGNGTGLSRSFTVIR